MVPTVAYSLGRLVTYSMVGLIFGALGMAINAGSSVHRWQQLATYFAGGLTIAIGVIALLRWSGIQIKLPGYAGPIQKLLQKLFQKTMSLSPLPRALVIGMLTSLMPCGWMYTFGITAAGTGSPISGVLLMVVFWAGTVPIMTALMLGFSRVGHQIQHRLPAVMAVLVICVGVFTLTCRAPIDLSGMNQPLQVLNESRSATMISSENGNAGQTEELVRQVKGVQHAELPCCRKN